MQDPFAVMMEILGDIAEDWDATDVSLDTRLIDLGIESISLVYLIAEMQQHYGLNDRLFRKMRAEGSLLKDMTVGAILRSIEELRLAAHQG